MNTDYPAVRQRVEAAVAAFLRNRPIDDTADPTAIRAGSVLDGVNVFMGQASDKWAMPCIVVLVDACVKLEGVVDEDWYDCSLQVHVMTARGERSEDQPIAAQKQSDRVGALADLMSDLPSVIAAVNAMDAGVALFGAFPEEQKGTVTDKHWDDPFGWRVHCALT